MTNSQEERILCIDYGRKRVGIAVSDPLGFMALPIETVKRKKLEQGIKEILNNYTIKKIIIGYPLRTDGKRGERAREVEEFAENIGEKFQITVELWDERYSTVEAERDMRTMGKKPSRNKEKIDKIAASLILQSYLDSRDG